MGNKTKTYSGKRILPIPDFLYSYIVEQINRLRREEYYKYSVINGEKI